MRPATSRRRSRSSAITLTALWRSRAGTSRPSAARSDQPAAAVGRDHGPPVERALAHPLARLGCTLEREVLHVRVDAAGPRELEDLGELDRAAPVRVGDAGLRTAASRTFRSQWQCPAGDADDHDRAAARHRRRVQRHRGIGAHAVEDQREAAAAAPRAQDAALSLRLAEASVSRSPGRHARSSSEASIRRLDSATFALSGRKQECAAGGAG